MITVFVGEEKETFPVHKDLLKLHSGLIFEHLAQEPENGKVSLPTLKPSMFAEFVLWMYTDDFLQVDHPSGEEDPCTQLWAMGAILKVQLLPIPAGPPH
jgi:hypothetical protein